jgi:hypothetical protein
MSGKIRDFGRHIDALARYEELREAIEDWSNQRRGGQNKDVCIP